MALPRRLAWTVLVLSVVLPLAVGIPSARRAAEEHATVQQAVAARAGSGSAGGQQPAGQPAATEGVAPGSRGLPSADVPSSGTFTLAAVRTDAPDLASVHTVAVEVEDSLPLRADDVAREVHATLVDPRGWQGWEGHGFQLVDDVAGADMVIKVSSGATTDELCAPLETRSEWSCRNGETVVVNYNRWALGTPTFAGFSLTEYHSYLINHEVGHWLGHDHLGCPAAGAPAPIMLQQSISLDGCKPNIWPADSDYR